MNKITFSRPSLGNKEIAAVGRVICSGWVAQGPAVQRFEQAFARYAGAKYACAVSSGTAALHLALLLVGVKPKETVITVSHSFIATANSIRHCAAEPLFVDVDLATYNISVTELEDCLIKKCRRQKNGLYYKSSRVAAILVVHQMGMPADLYGIIALAKKFRLPLVEDAACAAGSMLRLCGEKKWSQIGQPHGDIAVFSFHPRKVITTGEGGMLTTSNPDYDRRARLLRHQGMSVSDVVRHKAKKIIFEEYPVVGYNYRMSDLQAAVGIEQLKKLPEMLAERRKISGVYYQELRGLSWLRLPQEPKDCRTNWQSYPVFLKDNAPFTRNKLMQRLLDAGISTRRGVMNAHQEKPYAGQHISLKNSEAARDRVILLPIFCGMSQSQARTVARFFKRI